MGLHACKVVGDFVHSSWKNRPKSATTQLAKLAKKYLGITTTSLAEHVLCGPEYVHEYTFKQDPEEANTRLLYLFVIQHM